MSVFQTLKAIYGTVKTVGSNLKRSNLRKEDISLIKSVLKNNKELKPQLDAIDELRKKINTSEKALNSNKGIGPAIAFKNKSSLNKAKNSLNSQLKNLTKEVKKDDKLSDALQVPKSFKTNKQPPKKGLTKEESRLENQRQKDLKKQTIAQMKEDRLGGILGRTGRLTGVLPYASPCIGQNIYRIPRLGVTYGAGQELGLIDKNKGGDINEGLKKIPAGPKGEGLRALKKENPSLVREQFKYAKKGGKILAKKKKKKKVKYVGVGKALRGYGKVRRV